MSDTTTIARPYAKAVFELALETNQLAGWSDVLSFLAQVTMSPEAILFLNNPTSTAEQHAQFLLSMMSDVKWLVENDLIARLVSLLADNKRLFLISGILIEYEQLRADQEKTLTVNVKSFAPLSDAQRFRLTEKMTRRLQRCVSLEVVVDLSLLGGMVIQAGDLVIDGSVRGQLLKLASQIAA